MIATDIGMKLDICKRTHITRAKTDEEKRSGGRLLGVPGRVGETGNEMSAIASSQAVEYRFLVCKDIQEVLTSS